MERLIDVAVQQLSDLSEATSRIDATSPTGRESFEGVRLYLLRASCNRVLLKW